jgi:hypothetical protein
MIIGTTLVDVRKLISLVPHKYKFINYAKSIIPEDYRENTTIQANQVYYNCMLLNKTKSIDYRKLRSFQKDVLKDTFIVGYLDQIVALDEEV